MKKFTAWLSFSIDVSFEEIQKFSVKGNNLDQLFSALHPLSDSFEIVYQSFHWSLATVQPFQPRPTLFAYHLPWWQRLAQHWAAFLEFLLQFVSWKVLCTFFERNICIKFFWKILANLTLRENANVRHVWLTFYWTSISFEADRILCIKSIFPIRSKSARQSLKM